MVKFFSRYLNLRIEQSGERVQRWLYNADMGKDTKTLIKILFCVKTIFIWKPATLLQRDSNTGGFI